MSDTLPLSVDPWLMYRRNNDLSGILPLTEMPNLLASQELTSGHATAHLVVKKRDDGQTVIVGQAECEVVLICQRCMKPLETVIDTKFELVLVKYERQLSSVSDDDDAIVCEENLLIAPLVEQELILSLPMIAKHDDCQAAYENKAEVAAKTQQPFANLKDLLR